MNNQARGGGNSDCRWAGILIVANQEWPARVKDALNSRGVNLAVDNIGGKLFPEVIATMGELGRISPGGGFRRPGA